MNLISNSYKFTKNGGVIVQVEDLREEDLISISVKDTGIGIPDLFQSKIFNEYYKIDPPSGILSNGVGLGLYKCKELVKYLGGSIQCVSSVHFGSIFTFTFKKYMDINNSKNFIPLSDEPLIKKMPIVVPEPIIPIDQYPPIAQPPKITCECSKILIVDDDCQIRRILVHYAKRCDLPCDEAESGKKALELIRKKMTSTCCRSYQKILMDFLLIDMTGIEVAKNVKEELKIIPNHNLKITIITGVMNKISEADYDKSNPPFDRIEPKPILLYKFREIVK